MTESQKFDADKSLLGIDDMIYKLVRKIMPELCDADVEDVVQDTRIHLAYHVLPRFDPSRGIKFSTFAYRCIYLFLLHQRRRWKRQRKGLPELLDSADHRIVAPDTSSDRAVEQFALAVIEKPEILGLKPRHLKAVKGLLRSGPEVPMGKIGETLGIKPTHFSDLLGESRKHIAQLSTIG